MDAAQHRAAVVTEGGWFAALASDALELPVPTCPGWTVARLVGHLGRVHTWATGFLVAGPDAEGDVSWGERPPEGAALLPWYRDRLDGLLAELDRHDPGEPARSFIGAGTAAFWFRRQAHELAVHRWDAEHAIAPGAASPFDAALAADGIDEWLGVFVPRWLARRDEPVPAALVGATLHVHCTDDALAAGTGEWLLRVTDQGCEVERAHAKGDAALRGPASDLLLAVWHRVPLDSLDVVGDAARAQGVLDLVQVT